MAAYKPLSVVIPAYNSQDSLEPLVGQLQSVLGERIETFEILLVNDGSPDRTWQTIQELAERYPTVRGISLMRNYGQHNALLCGIHRAQYEVIVTMDDDLQHPPEAIFTLLDKLNEGYDVVYGAPVQEQHGVWRNMASQITKFMLQEAMGAETARQISAFRAFYSQLRQSFVQYNGPFVSIDVLLTWGTTNFVAIPVQHQMRSTGQSNYSFRKLVTHALNMMTGFSILPLQLASWMGFATIFFGIGILIYVVGRFIIEGQNVPGFPFLASIIAIFSGVQLFAIGIFGEYLARMHFRIMSRPSYSVREEIGAQHHDGT